MSTNAATAARRRWSSRSIPMSGSSAWAGQGFRAVKFGWGPMGQSEESDIAHVKAARRGIGDGIELMVDAGLCWDTATAIRRAQQFEPFRLTWLEEPLHPDNVEGYGRL